jgi:hypothetical protein
MVLPGPCAGAHLGSMPLDEREEEVGHREAERALGHDRKKTPPVSDQPAEEAVERRPGELEQTPSPRED